MININWLVKGSGMHNFQMLLISSIFFLKIVANGIGISNISIWFYLILFSFLLKIIDLTKTKVRIGKDYNRYLVKIILLSIVMFAVLTVNFELISNLTVWLQFISMIMFSVVLYTSINCEKDIYKIMKVLAFSITISSMFGLLQYINFELSQSIGSVLNFLNISNPDGTRITGLSTSPITFSYEVIVGIFITYNLLLVNKRKWILGFALLIMLVAMILNQTRSALIGILVGSILIKYFAGGIRTGKKIFSVLVVLLVLFVGYWLATPLFGIESRFTQRDFSSLSRIPMVITAFRYSMLHPFGTGVYKLYESGIDLSMYHSNVQITILENYTHNQFTNILVEFGYFGFAILSSIYYGLYKVFKNIKNVKLKIFKSKEIDILFATIIAYTVNALFHNGGILHAEPTIWFVFAMFYKIILIKKQNLIVKKEGGICEDTLYSS